MEVLLAGNTGYVTETFIEESFPECDVVVLPSITRVEISCNFIEPMSGVM